MKRNPNDILFSLLFTIIGVLLGIIGNFLVVTYYRVIDAWDMSSASVDLLTFTIAVICFVVILGACYIIIREIQSSQQNSTD